MLADPSMYVLAPLRTTVSGKPGGFSLRVPRFAGLLPIWQFREEEKGVGFGAWVLIRDKEIEGLESAWRLSEWMVASLWTAVEGMIGGFLVHWQFSRAENAISLQRNSAIKEIPWQLGGERISKWEFQPVLEKRHDIKTMFSTIWTRMLRVFIRSVQFRGMQQSLSYILPLITHFGFWNSIDKASRVQELQNDNNMIVTHVLM